MFKDDGLCPPKEYRLTEQTYDTVQSDIDLSKMIAPPAVTSMFLFIFAIFSFRDCACTKTLILENTLQEDHSKEVFVKEEDANTFLGRHLLFNRFDFEVFTPGNLERECYEEVCNYEEAREVFENDKLTKDFWKKYTEDKEKRPQLDVTSLLVGLIAAGVAVVIICLLFWYFCQGKCKDDFSRASSIRVRRRRSNASVILRRLEDVALQPIPPPPLEDIDSPGLPTYEQAVAKSGPHDAPPPPYPGSRHGSIRR